MDKLNKVLKGLECCENGSACGICPYSKNNDCTMGYSQALIKDTLELLKAAYPKPHCLTLEELRKVKPGTVLWREIYGDEPTVCNFSGTEKFWEINTDIYGESFRLWTAKPTDEQRKAVKWDESTKEEA